MNGKFDEWVAKNSTLKLVLRVLIVCLMLCIGYSLVDVLVSGGYMEQLLRIICFILVTWLLCYISVNLKNL